MEKRFEVFNNIGECAIFDNKIKKTLLVDSYEAIDRSSCNDETYSVNNINIYSLLDILNEFEDRISTLEADKHK